MMQTIQTIEKEIAAHIEILNNLKSSPTIYEIDRVGTILENAIKNGNKIISCGNGGSYSDAQHFASELLGRYRGNRNPISALALTDGGAISCVANDFGYGEVFARQIEALGRPGDVLLALSTSGNSENVFRATIAAKLAGMTVIGITGNSDNRLKSECHVAIEIPHQGTADRIQEATILVIHILVHLIELNLSENLK